MQYSKENTKKEGNLLNEKGEDRKLGKDVTENDQSMKSETLEPRSASLRNLAIYYVRILKIPIYLVVHTCIMKKTHVYKVQHQLEIKTNILYKTNMPFKMWKMKSYTKTNFFLRNKKIAPTYNTTNTSDFKPSTKKIQQRLLGKRCTHFIVTLLVKKQENQL